VPNPTAKIRLEAEPALGPGINQALRQIQGLAGSAKSLFAGAFAGISVAALTGIVNKTLEFGDALNAARIKAAVTGEAISELAYAAKQSNVELGGLSNSLRFMQKFMSEASTGGKEQAEALAALGLSVKELKNLRPEEMFERFGGQISKLRDPTDRARAALAVFGKAGAELLPLFEDGAEGVRKLREEARRIGQSFSTDQLKSLDAAKDSIDRMKSSFEGLATALVAKVSPALTKFFTSLTPGLSGVEGDIAALEERLRTGELWGAKLSKSQLATVRANLTKLQAQNLTPFTPTAQRMSASSPPGFRAPLQVPDEFSPTVSGLFDIGNVLRGSKPASIQAEDLVNIRFDQFGESLLENTEHIAEDMAEILEKPFGNLTVFAEQAARNMQDAFADFLFDPFQDGMRGMLKGFADVLRRMIAEAASAKLFEALTGGGGAGGGVLGSLFGAILGGLGGSSGLAPVKTTVSKLPSYAVGTNYVPRTGLALLHAGEAVIPAGRNGGGGMVFSPVYNIDARGATRELTDALPAILKRNSEETEARIVRRLQQNQYPRVRN
jgi:hypothetical protein